MSENMPARSLPAVEWLEARIAAWNTSYASIGLTSAQVVDLSQDVANARGSFTSVQEIRAESKGKTLEFHGKAKVARDKAAGMIANIKAYAETQTDPAIVYALANVSPADAPSPSAPPAQPVNLGYRVQSDGSIKVQWDATGPIGTIYNVTRQLPGETEFTFVGQGDGSDKSFVDVTVPAGTASASYRVQGVRGSLVGPQSVTFTVFFGAAGAVGASAAA
jgi:hypothetical protein